MRIALGWALALVLALSVAAAQDLPLQPYSYEEGFEGDSPALALWASNGSAPEIHFNGLSQDLAFAGQRALKLDVTLGDGSYYYLGLPLRVPCAGELKLTARVRVAELSKARVGFGANFVYPPSTHSGCGPFASWDKAGAEWHLVEQDLVATGRQGAAGVLSTNTATLTGQDVGVFLDRWSLFLYGQKGDRVVVYVDDLKLVGKVPEAKAYEKHLQDAFTQRTTAFRQKVAGWRRDYNEARRGLSTLGQTPPQGEAVAQALRDTDQRLAALLATLEKQGYANTRELNELQAGMAALKYGPDTLRAMREALRAQRPLLLYSCGNAVSYGRQAGQEGLLGGPAGGIVSFTACRGEYESRSAMVLALQDLKGLKVTASALRGTGSTIPASALDIRLVKWWYQGASGGIGYSPKKALLPELLVKDDALVRVDREKQENYLRSTNAGGPVEYLPCTGEDSSNLATVRPVDARELQPVDIPAGECREFWVNLQVPPGTPAGTYLGRLSFTSASGSGELPLRVTVNSFDLEPSRLTYSIYYRARLAPDGQPTITSELRSEQQYRAEIADMKAHGVLYPTNYQGWDEKLLRRVLEIRREEGLPAGRFYNLGLCVLPQKSPEALAAVIKQVRAWITLLQEYGYDQPYFYGIDEATGEMLKSQREAWGAAQEAGAKTFVACYQGTFEAMGKLLNCAVIAGAPDLEEVRKWHSVGSEIFCYANPQVGVEDPQIYRRNFGLRLWQAGYDGAMDYAYQHGFNHVWNDFDDRTYRDHNFTYPTVDGVVGTIAWEGFREGVDDVRYFTTLENAIKAASACGSPLAKQAQQWMHSPALLEQDLNVVRSQAADWIVRLKGVTAPTGGGGYRPLGGG